MTEPMDYIGVVASLARAALDREVLLEWPHCEAAVGSLADEWRKPFNVFQSRQKVSAYM